MCETCGCGGDDSHDHDHAHAHEHDHAHAHDHAQGHDHAHEHDHVGLEIRILEKNDRIAAENRGFFRGREVLALNLMSSPGSGKTTLLERTLAALSPERERAYVLEGDQATTRDADRLRAAGAVAFQINTGKGCHLDADMVRRGLDALKPTAGGILFIENVGNLVCPALFDLGESARVVLFSVTEGEDKPLKYPHMFRTADVVLMTKIDLLPHLDFDLASARANVLQVKPSTPIIEISARSGAGMDSWLAWIRGKNAATAARPPSGA